MTSREKILRVWAREQEKWGLEDWKLVFSNQRRHLGYCKPRRRIISLSLAFMNANPYPVMKDTLLHEIAHAIHYIETGKTNHDNGWREVARRVGCRPERCAPVDGLVMPRGKYVGVCPVCRKAVHFYRKVRRSYSCNDCTNGYDSKYKLKMMTTEKYEMNGGRLRTPIAYKKARSK
jgi:predicted SprT family Zn-dependent metalloprotease